MCGITGIVNLTKDISSYRNVLKNMMDTINKRGPDEEGQYIESHILLGHKRLIVIDPIGGKQPMKESFNENNYTIIYNGQIYNTKEIKQDLKDAGFTFNRSFRYRSLIKSIYIIWIRRTYKA